MLFRAQACIKSNGGDTRYGHLEGKKTTFLAVFFIVIKTTFLEIFHVLFFLFLFSFKKMFDTSDRYFLCVLYLLI